MTNNPYLDEIRKAAYHEKASWIDRAEELAENDDCDLTEEEIEKIANDMYQKTESSLYYTDDYIDSLPQLLSSLNGLGSEWNTMSNRLKDDVTDENRIRWGFYGEVSRAAWDEAEKVQFVMEEYLL